MVVFAVLSSGHAGGMQIMMQWVLHGEQVYPAHGATSDSGAMGHSGRQELGRMR